MTTPTYTVMTPLNATFHYNDLGQLHHTFGYAAIFEDNSMETWLDGSKTNEILSVSTVATPSKAWYDTPFGWTADNSGPVSVINNASGEMKFLVDGIEIDAGTYNTLSNVVNPERLTARKIFTEIEIPDLNLTEEDLVEFKPDAATIYVVETTNGKISFKTEEAAALHSPKYTSHNAVIFQKKAYVISEELAIYNTVEESIVGEAINSLMKLTPEQQEQVLNAFAPTPTGGILGLFR